jgi:hypothetical protein
MIWLLLFAPKLLLFTYRYSTSSSYLTPNSNFIFDNYTTNYTCEAIKHFFLSQYRALRVLDCPNLVLRPMVSPVTPLSMVHKAQFPHYFQRLLYRLKVMVIAIFPSSYNKSICSKIEPEWIMTLSPIIV